jgi:hypothetical protein
LVQPSGKGFIQSYFEILIPGVVGELILRLSPGLMGPKSFIN